MSNLRYFAVFVFFILATSSCNNEEETNLIGNWIKKSDFEGFPRNNATVFVIGNKAYVGQGYDGDDYLNDLWEYDPVANFWTQKAALPTEGRSSAVGFGIGGKGYIGTGYDGEDERKDFWEFDPANNTWQRKADFGGTARRGAVAFALLDRGYIGTGNDGNDLKDFWQYDPVPDKWTQVVSLGGSKRINAFAFVINNRAYVGGGRNNGVYEEDFWEYDPQIANWNQKGDMNAVGSDDTDITREGAATFVIADKAYLVSGSKGSATKDVWEYDPFNDFWRQKTALEGVARTEAVSFGVNGRGFITTGRNSQERYDDLWEFDPLADSNDDD